MPGSTGVPPVMIDIILNLCLHTWQFGSVRVSGGRFVSKWDNHILTCMVCELQLNVYIRQLCITPQKQVWYFISICLPYCFHATKYICFSKVDQPVQTSYKMSMRVWIFRSQVSGDQRLSTVLLFHRQRQINSHTFFFCTLSIENNIRTENFFVFPKQEVTYDQNSRGKKLADKYPRTWEESYFFITH